jgi:hypothetical protein
MKSAITERPELTADEAGVSPTERPTRRMAQDHRSHLRSLARDARGDSVPTPASVPRDQEWAGFSPDMNAIFEELLATEESDDKVA